MTDLTKLADALESMATYNGELLDEEWSSLHEAARILRAAAAVDVAGLMALAGAMANAQSVATLLAPKVFEQQSSAYQKADAEYLEAEAALESALRMALAASAAAPKGTP